MKSIRDFLWILRAVRRHGIPLTRWNIRAAWLQATRATWVADTLDMSDEEWDAWMEAMEGS